MPSCFPTPAPPLGGARDRDATLLEDAVHAIPASGALPLAEGRHE